MLHLYGNGMPCIFTNTSLRTVYLVPIFPCYVFQYRERQVRKGLLCPASAPLKFSAEMLRRISTGNAAPSRNGWYIRPQYQSLMHWSKQGRGAAKKIFLKHLSCLTIYQNLKWWWDLQHACGYHRNYWNCTHLFTDMQSDGKSLTSELNFGWGVQIFPTHSVLLSIDNTTPQR